MLSAKQLFPECFSILERSCDVIVPSVKYFCFFYYECFLFEFYTSFYLVISIIVWCMSAMPMFRTVYYYFFRFLVRPFIFCRPSFLSHDLTFSSARGFHLLSFCFFFFFAVSLCLRWSRSPMPLDILLRFSNLNFSYSLTSYICSHLFQNTNVC